MNTVMKISDERRRTELGRFWTSRRCFPGQRRYETGHRSDPALWPVIPVKGDGFDGRLSELSARLEELKKEHDAFTRDMDRRGKEWTRGIRRNMEQARENAETIERTAAEDKERAARIEQDSLDRDAELDGRAQDIDGRSVERDVYVMETSLERDTALSAAIDQIEPGQQIDYTEYFKQIVSGQFDYRPYLMRLLRTQGYMEENP